MRVLLNPVSMTRTFAIWSFGALWAGSALAATCGSNSSSPFAVPIKDTQVDPSIAKSFMRGIPASIGTPFQKIVLLPWPELNNTFIYDDQLSCNERRFVNDVACRIRRGGPFLESKSTSFTKTSDIIAAGGATQEISATGAEPGIPSLLSNSLAGTEHFSPTGSSNATTFPIGIPRIEWDTGFTAMHALGLGPSSTYLNALVAAKQIPSRVWSIFWGRMWTANSATDMDGSLVFGGYDEEKVTGSSLTQALDYSATTGCWTGMMVTVADLVVNFRNGSSTSVLPRNTAVRSCVVPQRQLLWEGPADYIWAFQRLASIVDGGAISPLGLHALGRNINNSDVSSVFDGDVTFTISSGSQRLDIRVPNNQFIVPQVDILANGSRSIDTSKKGLLLSPLAGTNPSTLGRYFFTSAYLMVDHDAHSFTMWQANPTTKSNLVPVVSKSTGSDGCESGGGGSNSGNNTNGGENGASSGSSGSSTGAIAGGVVGGVAGLVIIAALVFFFLRRRKQQQQQRQSLAPSAMVSPWSPTTDGAQGQQGYLPKYAAHDNSGPKEVPGTPMQLVELRADEHHRPQELYGEQLPLMNQGGQLMHAPVSGGQRPLTFELEGSSGAVGGNGR